MRVAGTTEIMPMVIPRHSRKMLLSISVYQEVNGESDFADLLNMAVELVRPDRSSGLRCTQCLPF